MFEIAHVAEIKKTKTGNKAHVRTRGMAFQPNFLQLLYKVSRALQGNTTQAALGRKMLKLPIARHPAIKVDLINRKSGETDNIYEANVQFTST